MFIQILLYSIGTSNKRNNMQNFYYFKHIKKKKIPNFNIDKFSIGIGTCIIFYIQLLQFRFRKCIVKYRIPIYFKFRF